jgi:hypothetical protein
MSPPEASVAPPQPAPEQGHKADEIPRRKAEDERAIMLASETPNQRAARVEAEWEQQARNIEDLGFEVKAYSRLTGQGAASGSAETAEACARICAAEKCSGFFFHNEGIDRICYRFSGSVTVETTANSRYTAGVRKQLASIKPTLISATSIVSDQPVQLAQGTPPPDANGVVHCPYGAYKVPGFRVLCDRLLGGGMGIGTAQRRTTVSDINECASICQGVHDCTAFAYGVLIDKGICQIYGKVPFMRKGEGMVSAVRGPVRDETIGDRPIVDYSK